MKKKAMVAAILAATTLSATTAFAATNPFKDVPKDHWAYDAVNMLAKDGVLEGYGDGNFNGDKLMNRYEMAEIVSKALEKYDTARPADKGAIKKLSREFAAELKDMDARLTAVEGDVQELKKNQSSFKWYGDTRLRFFQNKDNKMTHPNAYWDSAQAGKERQWEKRVRLGIWGNPAKNLSVDARLKYEDNTGVHSGAQYSTTDPNNANFNSWNTSYRNQSDFKLDKMSLFWDNAGTRVAVGRNEFNLGQGGLWWENSMDGAYVSHQFGPKVNIMAGYGDMSAEGWQDTNMWAYFTNTTVKASPATTITFATLHTNSDLSAAKPSTNTYLNYSIVNDNAIEAYKGNSYAESRTSGIVDTAGTKHEWTKSVWTDSSGAVKGWDSNGEFDIDVAKSSVNGSIQATGASTSTTTTWNKKDYKFNQFALGINTQLAPKWNLIAEGIYNNIADTRISNSNYSGKKLDRKGFWSRLTYGNMDWKKGGTWKVYGEYFALGNASVDSTFWGHRLNIAGGNSSFKSGDNRWGNGDRGWGIGVDYMLAANTNLEFCYYKLKPFDKHFSDSDFGSFSRYDDVALAALTYSF